MKKAIRIFITALLCAVLAVSTAAAASAPAGLPEDAAVPAEHREEVIYANLTNGGAIMDIYAVNLLTVSGDAIIDFGDYASVKNLTDTAPLSLAGDRVTLQAEKSSFYYQGTLNRKELPWIINITYFLDGAEIAPEALAGQTGHVAVLISTAGNPAVEDAYFNNYMLTISVALDTSLCRSIKASGGMAANAGGDKRITFMAMPGEASEFKVETDAAGFEMPGIEFSALPLAISIKAPDTGGMKADLAELTDAIGQLSDGAAELKSGCQQLTGGAAELKNGSAHFAGGIGRLSGSAATLLGGSAQIKDALAAMSGALAGTSLPDAATDTAGSPADGIGITGLTLLPDALDQTAAGLGEMSAGLRELQASFKPSYQALAAAVEKIPAQLPPEDGLGALYAGNPDQKELIDLLVGYYRGGAETKATFENVQPALDAVETALGETIAGADQTAQGLTVMAQQIRTGLDGNATAAQLKQLGEGLAALAAQYGEFHAGLTDFASGATELGSQYAALDDGISGLADGTAALEDGIAQASDGAAELHDGVSDLPAKIDEEIQKLMDSYDKSDYRPVSFVSGKNVNTASVQFVMKTAPIEKPEAPAEPVPEPAPENLWTRFLALFR